MILIWIATKIFVDFLAMTATVRFYIKKCRIRPFTVFAQGFHLSQ